MKHPVHLSKMASSPATWLWFVVCLFSAIIGAIVSVALGYGLAGLVIGPVAVCALVISVPYLARVLGLR